MSVHSGLACGQESCDDKSMRWGRPLTYVWKDRDEAPAVLPCALKDLG